MPVLVPLAAALLLLLLLPAGPGRAMTGVGVASALGSCLEAEGHSKEAEEAAAAGREQKSITTFQLRKGGALSQAWEGGLPRAKDMH